MLLDKSKVLEPLFRRVCELYLKEEEEEEENEEVEVERIHSFSCPEDFTQTGANSVCLTTAVQSLPTLASSTLKPKWGASRTAASFSAGRLHPSHASFTQTSLLLCLGEPNVLQIDGPGCACKLTGEVWCSKGKHWMTAATAPEHGAERAEGEECECRSGGCEKDEKHEGRCQSCRFVEMKSGDVLLFGEWEEEIKGEGRRGRGEERIAQNAF